MNLQYINKGRSKVTDIMKLMRKLIWFAAKNNFTIYSEHVPGVPNVIWQCVAK
jgi:hypothetical protein